jgi:NAD-reducing hydrogenase large subunit
MNKHLQKADRDALLGDSSQAILSAVEAVDAVSALEAASPSLYQSFGLITSNFLALSGPRGALDYYDGTLRAIDAAGKNIFEGISPADYGNYLHESVKPWTYMKFPFMEQLGPEAGWYRVGPLARLNVCDSIGTPLAEKARQDFFARSGGKPVQGSLAYHHARMIEMLHCAEEVGWLLADEDLVAGELMAQGKRTDRGVGIIEAPRGTLIHDYEVGPDDLVTQANLIVATTNNNQAMNEAIKRVARDCLKGHRLTGRVLNQVEVAIRAYDPCLSCATHALGAMPLEVELFDTGGRLVDRLVRDSDGELHG